MGSINTQATEIEQDKKGRRLLPEGMKEGLVCVLSLDLTLVCSDSKSVLADSQSH
jgi:hypothetical protein